MNYVVDFLQNNPNCMAIWQIEDIEVINIINSRNNSSTGRDGITSLLAKILHHILFIVEK